MQHAGDGDVLAGAVHVLSLLRDGHGREGLAQPYCQPFKIGEVGVFFREIIEVLLDMISIMEGGRRPRVDTNFVNLKPPFVPAVFSVPRSTAIGRLGPVRTAAGTGVSRSRLCE